MSDRGFEFAVRQADAVFVGGRSLDEHRAHSRKAKAIAARQGMTIRTYAMCTLVHAKTDAAAEALVRRYAGGVDLAAVTTMLKSWGAAPERLAEEAEAQGAFMTPTLVGSPATLAEKTVSMLDHCELDGLMLIFPDYGEGLGMFGSEILPKLREAA